MPEPFERRRPRPSLVLDAGGVVVTEPMGLVLTRLASASPLDRGTIEARYRSELYDRFWSGSLEAELFWDALIDLGDARIHPDELREVFFGSLFVQAAVASVLPRWRRIADLYLLSNHRSEWLLPLLQEQGLTDVFEKVWISDVMRSAKPTVDLYRGLAAHLPRGSPVLYVDDDARNLASGVQVGWSALEAGRDPERWLPAVGSWLEESSAAGR